MSHKPGARDSTRNSRFLDCKCLKYSHPPLQQLSRKILGKWSDLCQCYACSWLASMMWNPNNWSHFSLHDKVWCNQGQNGCSEWSKEKSWLGKVRSCRLKSVFATHWWCMSEANWTCWMQRFTVNRKSIVEAVLLLFCQSSLFKDAEEQLLVQSQRRHQACSDWAIPSIRQSSNEQSWSSSLASFTSVSKSQHCLGVPRMVSTSVHHARVPRMHTSEGPSYYTWLVSVLLKLCGWYLWTRFYLRT